MMTATEHAAIEQEKHRLITLLTTTADQYNTLLDEYRKLEQRKDIPLLRSKNTRYFDQRGIRA